MMILPTGLLGLVVVLLIGVMVLLGLCAVCLATIIDELRTISGRKD